MSNAGARGAGATSGAGFGGSGVGWGARGAGTGAGRTVRGGGRGTGCGRTCGGVGVGAGAGTTSACGVRVTISTRSGSRSSIGPMGSNRGFGVSVRTRRWAASDSASAVAMPRLARDNGPPVATMDKPEFAKWGSDPNYSRYFRRRIRTFPATVTTTPASVTACQRKCSNTEEIPSATMGTITPMYPALVAPTRCSSVR
jgi:hypothetical protein